MKSSMVRGRLSRKFAGLLVRVRKWPTPLLAVFLVAAVWGGSLLMPKEAYDGVHALIGTFLNHFKGDAWLAFFVLFTALRLLLLPLQICRPSLTASENLRFWFADYTSRFANFCPWNWITWGKFTGWERFWERFCIVFFCLFFIVVPPAGLIALAVVLAPVSVVTASVLIRSVAGSRLNPWAYRNSILCYIVLGPVLCLTVRTYHPSAAGTREWMWLPGDLIAVVTVVAASVHAWILRMANAILRFVFERWNGPCTTLYEELCAFGFGQEVLLYIPTYVALVLADPAAGVAQEWHQPLVPFSAFVTATYVVSLVTFAVSAFVAERAVPRKPR